MLSQYDKDNDDKLSFKEFLPIVLPLDDSNLHFEVVQKEIYRVPPNERLAPELETILVNLFQIEIELIIDAENNRNELMTRKDFNHVEIFKNIDIKHERFIDFESLEIYLRRNKVDVQEDDIVAFTRRFDSDLDCKLSLVEFMNGILPIGQRLKGRQQILKFATKTSYSTNNKKTLPPRKKSLNKTISQSSRKIVERNLLETTQPVKTPLKNKIQNEIIDNMKFYSEQKQNPIKQKSPLKSILKNNENTKSASKKEDQITIAQLMKKQIEKEKLLEELKENIAAMEDVTLESLYEIFDPGNNGYITPIDFMGAYRKFNLNPTEDELYKVFNRFDRDVDGKLKEQDINDIFNPQKQQYKDLISKRKGKVDSISNESCNIIKKLLRKYINVEKRNCCWKKNLMQIDVRKEFEYCDVEKKGFLSISNVF